MSSTATNRRFQGRARSHLRDPPHARPRLAAVDVYTASTVFTILESIRLDLGIGSEVHP
jgi:hypothetical protein